MTGKVQTPEEFLRERGLRFKAQRDGLRLLPPKFNLISLKDSLFAVEMAKKQAIEYQRDIDLEIAKGRLESCALQVETAKKQERENERGRMACLWGSFNLPKKNPVNPTQGSKIHLMPPSKDRREKRSITPSGFAKAFFEANK